MVQKMDIPEHKTIRLSGKTLKDLAERKSEGQSWDGVVSELLEEVKDKKN